MSIFATFIGGVIGASIVIFPRNRNSHVATNVIIAASMFWGTMGATIANGVNWMIK